MAEASSPVMAPAERFVITRILDAPREIVFRAWTEPVRLAHWFGGEASTTTSQLDVRPGGAFRVCVRSAEGTDSCLRGVYREIVKPERLVFTWLDEARPDFETLVTVTLADDVGRTKLTFTSSDSSGDALQGWTATLDRLGGYLAPRRAPADRVLTLTRVFDAPRELVFKCWIEPEHIVRWMGAKDWTTPSAEADPRPGGAFRIEMRALDGSQGFFFEGVYDEIVEPERLAYTTSDGRPATVTFDDVQGRKTKLTLTLVMAMDEELERRGYGQILDRLAEHLAGATGEPVLIITRLFDAPRELVFEAWTKAEHLVHWFSPKALTVPIAESDPRPGGAFRVCMRTADGTDYWARGVYREVVEPKRIVCMLSGEGEEGSIADTLLTVSFTDYAGKTKLTVHQSGIPSTERAGASEGWSESLDKLAAYLARP